MLVGGDRPGAVVARGDDNLGRHQVVAGHAEVAGEEAQAAAERRTSEPDGRLPSGRHGKALFAKRRHDLTLGEPRPDGHSAGRRVEPGGLHLTDVDDDPAGDIRPALKAVAATARPQRDIVLACPGDRADDVLRRLGEDDHQGVGAVEPVPVGASLGVRRAVGVNDPAGELSWEALARRHGRHFPVMAVRRVPFVNA